MADGLYDHPVDASDMVLRASWRLAKSLAVLLEEANEVAPDRDKGLDGTIGDASHAARVSRHNPYKGVVTALDITHDPEHGMDTYALFEWLRTYPHPNCTYVISNRRFAARTSGWVVKPYSGTHAHDGHIHVAVGAGPDSAPFSDLSQVDNDDPWGLVEWKEGGMDPILRECILLTRLSAMARSWDEPIAEAREAGDQARVATLKNERKTAVEAERIRLGLTKAQAAGI